jgi:uncharacterized membrane protein
MVRVMLITATIVVAVGMVITGFSTGWKYILAELASIVALAAIGLAVGKYASRKDRLK